MADNIGNEGGGFAAPVFNFVLKPSVEPAQLRENMLSSLGRGLPEVSPRTAPNPPHDHILSIAGGGPSLAETYKEMRGHAAAVNGSLTFLLEHGVVPNACGVCHPEAHMVDIVEPHPDVTYYLASIVHPSLFDKLLSHGCKVVLWNCTSVPGAQKTLNEMRGSNWLEVGGGPTMGLRWLTLGYTFGFRKFQLHGLDSSFRIDPVRGKASHAYPDHQDEYEWIEFEGYKTRPNFIGQVMDFLTSLERFKDSDAEPISLTVHGDGFLQDQFRRWKKVNPGWHEGPPKPSQPLLTDGFLWPEQDRDARPAILEEVKYMDKFLAFIPRRQVAVQAGGNVGVYPAYLSRRFDYVHTFEPDPVNYKCLSQNIQTVGGSIHAYNAALGEADGTCSVKLTDPGNTGTVQIAAAPGDIEMRRIDSLGLPSCDLIWLDCEGYERRVLEGAEQTIEKFWPSVIIEDNGTGVHEAAFGLPAGAARDWLHERGYVSVIKLGNDELYIPTC